MANIRQYIGARYVIKIYENSTDPSSAEWEQGNFEPLVMVTWQNGSYLSKKEVPGTIGDPANNPSYWVQTGFYNGQIAALQQQVNTINTALQTLTSNVGDLTALDTTDKTSLVAAINEVIENSARALSKKYIILSDSLGNGYLGSTGYNFIVTAMNALGIDATDYDDLHQSSIGFHDDGFIDLLDTYTLTPDEVTDIIVCCGNNDLNYQSALATNVRAFKEHALSIFPNAEITIVNDMWRPFSTALAESTSIYRTIFRNLKDACDLNNIRYYNGNYCLHNSTYYLSEGIHPTTTGVDALAKMLESVISGNGEFNYANANTFTASNMTGALYFKVDAQGVDVWCGDTGQYPAFSVSGITLDPSTAVKIATFTRHAINCQEDHDMYFNVPCRLYDGSTYSNHLLAFTVKGGELYAKLCEPNAISGINQIIMYPFDHTFSCETW